MEAKKIKRVDSVDIYRGLVMFLMMAEVWHLSGISENNPESALWGFLAFHQSHVPWIGCSLHDLIQPSFSFLVGVALPFSIASRIKKGESQKMMWYHAFRRSITLILLGVFLRSMYSEMTNWTFEDTLSQIGLGYPFLFFLGFKNSKWQWSILTILLLMYWLAFSQYPVPAAEFNYAAVGVPEDWPHLMEGFQAHWNKNANLAWAFDTWFLNLFPRENAFLFNGGGYATLSFIPTLGTMILGLIAGKMIKNKETDLFKKWSVIGLALVIIALAIHYLGINPIVKRIWTPNWTLFSGGVCFLILALFHWLIDMKGLKKPFHWLKIIGMNSIAAYVLAHTLNEFIDNSFRIHIGQNYDLLLGNGFSSLISGSLILICQWLILKWMYNKNIFIKI